MHSKDTEKRTCRECEQPFDKRPKESWNGYSLRIYCGKKCMLTWMAKQRAIAYKRKSEGGAANAKEYPIGPAGI